MKRSLLAIALLLICPLVAFADDDILTTAASNGSFNTLVSLVIAADLDDALSSHGEFTVFAPTDEAFASLPEGTLDELRKPENRDTLAAILKYHVVGQEISVANHPPSHPLRSIATLQGDEIRFERDGNELDVNETNVVARNISCSNGLIHVIDGVLLPPEEDNTIVGVAQNAGSFSTLLAAAEAAGLVDALKSEGPLTVFAPTDDAFAALPDGTVESLLKPENKNQLATILKYHVVSGRIGAREAVSAGSAETLAGDDVKISIRDGQLFINDSNVISNDIEAENGIIHVIDQVLLPLAGETHTSSTGSTSSDRPDEITITSSWDNPVTRDGVTASRIIIRCNGAGSINLTNVDAHEIVTRVSGGGSVSVDGCVERHEVVVAGGGVLRARDLVSSDTQIQVNGGGIATVNATETLKASANGGATLRYVDTGAEIEKSINRYAEFTAITAESTHH